MTYCLLAGSNSNLSNVLRNGFYYHLTVNNVLWFDVAPFGDFARYT